MSGQPDTSQAEPRSYALEGLRGLQSEVPRLTLAMVLCRARVEQHRNTDLAAALAAMPSEVGVYGTFLDGDNIYTQPLDMPAVMIMGNEGRGISEAVARTVNRRLYIPSVPLDGSDAVESLNVATATAICLSEFAARRYR